MKKKILEIFNKIFCTHKYGEFNCTYYEGFPPEIHGFWVCCKCGHEKYK